MNAGQIQEMPHSEMGPKFLEHQQKHFVPTNNKRTKISESSILHSLNSGDISWDWQLLRRKGEDPFQWASSGLKFADFLQETHLDQFLKDNKLE